MYNILFYIYFKTVITRLKEGGCLMVVQYCNFNATRTVTEDKYLNTRCYVTDIKSYKMRDCLQHAM